MSHNLRYNALPCPWDKSCFLFADDMMLSGGAAAAAGYVIEGSGVFNPSDNDHLERTGMSAGDSNTTGTLEIVFKRSLLTSDQVLVGANNTSSSDLAYIRWESADKITIVVEPTDASTALSWTGTSQEFRDPSAWEQLVIQFDTTEASAGDRCTIEHNGVDITANFTQTTDIGQNKTIPFCDPDSMKIGQHPANSNNDFGGYIARVSWVDGSALDATNYGEETNDGYWQINDISGLTYGTNGFLLEGGTDVAAGNDSQAPDAGYTNDVTLGETYDASGSTNFERACDDDRSNQWSEGSSGTSAGAWWEVTFAAAKHIRRISLYTASGNNVCTDIDVEYWDGDSWEVAQNITPSADTTTQFFTIAESASSTKWRLITKVNVGAPYSWAINELEMQEAGDGLNHFTPSGTITATNDSPTNDADNDYGNYATWNPNQLNASVTLSDGNRVATGGGTSQDTMAASTLNIPTGMKIYCEFGVATSASAIVGVFQADAWGADWDNLPAGGRSLHLTSGNILSDGGSGTIVSNYAPNDGVPATIMMAADLENDLVYWGDAATDLWSDGAGAYDQAFSTATGTALTADIAHKIGCRTWSGVVTLNTGQTAYTGTPPTGYGNLATQDMIDPTIPDPSQYHDVELVSHNGTTGSFTVPVSADTNDYMFSIKDRDNTEKWWVFDSLRGLTKYISWDSSTGETTDATTLSASGTTITMGAAFASSNYVVEWWRAGETSGAGVSNTDGTITTTISANTTSGFSIILWTGTQANATIGHGLDSAPEFTSGFKRDGGEGHWGQHADLTSGVYGIKVDTTGAQASGATQWNSTFPSATVISLGSSNATNFSGSMMMYAWHGVEGYSAFGSFEGNGNAAGSAVSVGFKPTSVLLKSIDSTSNWHKYDTSREGYNVDNDRLNLDTTAAEGTADEIDIVSNGVKLRIATDPNVAETYIYGMWGGRPIQGPGSGSVNQGRAR